MPFSGITPGSKLERDIDKCVSGIRSDNPGMGKSQAIAICRSSLEKQMDKEETIEEVLPEGEETPSKDMHGPRRRMHPDDDEEKRTDEMFVNPGATSFAELDEVEVAQEAANQIRRRTGQFNGLIDNIIMDPDIDDKAAEINDLAIEFGALAGDAMTNRKERWQPLTDAVVNAVAPLIDKQETPMKTEGGIKFPAGDFAFVPDPEKPSTWKLPLAEDRPGNITRTKLGSAAAAFSPGGLRGKKVQIPAGDVAAVKAKIRAAYHKIGVADEDIPASVRKEIETKNSFNVYKQKDGSYRWIAIYSNKFRDRDNPPEIISEASHLNFAKSVNAGELPLPELWLWHIDGSKWGVADFVGYDDNGFAVGTGTVDKGKEWVADALMDFEGELLTSHGMPPWSIQRDPNDATIIMGHITKEISPLPGNVAANEFTGFTILGSEVKQMAFSDEERAKLLALNINPDTLEAQTEQKAQEAEGLEYKEADKQSAPGDYVGRSEMTDLIKSVGATQNQLVEVVGALAGSVKELQENKLTIDKVTLESTPAASLMDLYTSVIGSPEAKIDGRSSLAKSGPQEAEPEAPGGAQVTSNLARHIALRNQQIERGVQ